jgi:hypothetical protein
VVDSDQSSPSPVDSDQKGGQSAPEASDRVPASAGPSPPASMLSWQWISQKCALVWDWCWESFAAVSATFIAVVALLVNAWSVMQTNALSKRASSFEIVQAMDSGAMGEAMAAIEEINFCGVSSMETVDPKTDTQQLCATQCLENLVAQECKQDPCPENIVKQLSEVCKKIQPTGIGLVAECRRPLDDPRFPWLVAERTGVVFTRDWKASVYYPVEDHFRKALNCIDSGTCDREVLCTEMASRAELILSTAYPAWTDAGRELGSLSEQVILAFYGECRPEGALNWRKGTATGATVNVPVSELLFTRRVNAGILAMRHGPRRIDNFWPHNVPIPLPEGCVQPEKSKCTRMGPLPNGETFPIDSTELPIITDVFNPWQCKADAAQVRRCMAAYPSRDPKDIESVPDSEPFRQAACNRLKERINRASLPRSEGAVP